MKGWFRSSRPAGFSLVEMLIVVVIIGLMALFAFPRAAAVMDHAQVKGARTKIVNKFNAARVAARTSNRIASMQYAAGVIWVQLESPTLMVGGTETLDGVTVTGPSQIRVDPRGMASVPADLGTYLITRNGWRDSVTINAYGRITR